MTADEKAEIALRYQALKLSLDSISSTVVALPEATPWLHPLAMLAIDLTSLGCIVRVEVIVQPDVLRTHPLIAPGAPRIRLVMPQEQMDAQARAALNDD